MKVAGWMLAVWLAGTVQGTTAELFRLESAGVRGGFSGIKNNDGPRFGQVESYVNLNLPWRWEWSSDWHLQTRLDLSGGWINGRGEDAVIGTAGPSFELIWDKVPVSLTAGSSPTVLGREQFGKTDFGTVFQFTSHIGVTWKIGPHVRLGYRYQHMSNAGIGPSNPGLNLHMFSAGWGF